MNKKQIIVENDRKIVDLIQDFGFSFADINKMLRNKDVKVNGKPVKDNVVLRTGDEVVFYYSSDMLEKKFDIIYEDVDVLVVYKHAGIETDGEKGIEKAVPGAIAVHRLDRNTEGLVVFAKNRSAEEKLLKAFKNGNVHKIYLTEVVGRFECENKIFEAYLKKDKENAFVKISSERGKDSVLIKTKVNTLKAGNESSELEVEILTGKTHQIRAHLAFLGHAIIGDGKYGKNEDNKKFKLRRQKLACFKLSFETVGIDGLDGKTFYKLPQWANRT